MADMRTLLLAGVASLFIGCAAGGGGGSLIPVKAVGSIAGDSTGPQVFVAGVPVTALLKIHGNFTYTVQPVPPYATYDGDFQVIWEPAPGMEVEAQNAVIRGDILLRRDGVPTTLNAPGSIQQYKADLYRAWSKPAESANPPAPPPPSIVKPMTYVDPESMPECVGTTCRIPCPR